MDIAANLKAAATCLSGLAALFVLSFPAHAAECDPGKAGADLTGDEAMAVYECIADDLYAGYQKNDKDFIDPSFVKEYRNWTLASSIPGAPGFHGGRFLMTFVSEPGAEEYLKYKEEDVIIPAGTLIAKESFSVTDEGKVRNGPLFLMQKVAAGVSPETMDWYYMAVQPNGKPLRVDVVKACSQCHMENFGSRGGLGYPIEEARIGQ